jgi:hypothetical protein
MCKFVLEGDIAFSVSINAVQYRSLDHVIVIKTLLSSWKMLFWKHEKIKIHEFSLWVTRMSREPVTTNYKMLC